MKINSNEFRIKAEIANWNRVEESAYIARTQEGRCSTPEEIAECSAAKSSLISLLSGLGFDCFSDYAISRKYGRVAFHTLRHPNYASLETAASLRTRAVRNEIIRTIDR